MQNLDALLRTIDQLKSQIDQKRPLDDSILHALDLEYTYDSNRIEGNTLDLRETTLVIDKGLTIGGKSMREHLEALNHYEAVLLLRDWIRDQIPFNEYRIKQLHGLILRGIDRDNAGVYRRVPVMIAGSRHIPPQPWQVAKLMEDSLLTYQQVLGVEHTVILAARMHERIATIHPFIDGNGRTARLVMNLILLQGGYPIAAIGGDTENRKAYYAALEAANQNDDPHEFFKFIAQQVLAALQRLWHIITHSVFTS